MRLTYLAVLQDTELKKNNNEEIICENDHIYVKELTHYTHTRTYAHTLTVAVMFTCHDHNA